MQANEIPSWFKSGSRIEVYVELEPAKADDPREKITRGYLRETNLGRDTDWFIEMDEQQLYDPEKREWNWIPKEEKRFEGKNTAAIRLRPMAWREGAFFSTLEGFHFALYPRSADLTRQPHDVTLRIDDMMRMLDGQERLLSSI